MKYIFFEFLIEIFHEVNIVYELVDGLSDGGIDEFKESYLNFYCFLKDEKIIFNLFRKSWVILAKLLEHGNMNFEVFDLLITRLMNEEKYDEADKILDGKIDAIYALPLSEAVKFLELYASIAGDVDSFDRFDRLFCKLLAVDKVSHADRSRYEGISPANRWL
ncbi:hypothetical protein EC844_12926 [Acinetobacter calcoaceticus]|uniref:Uncharacterized protein n=1 Tax=Acinetobacter calcoaceticus TaxID=471 RepID=A0A4R1XNJ0_ACICA|nr:hypothetical protein EC844_12926 [Acinetobacter calcoaceticus]